MTRGALGTDIGPEGKPSRPRRRPPTRPAADDPPRWDGAACEGRWGEFDLDLIRGDTQGLNAAIAICRSCPCLTACHDFARRTKATGVVQGGTAWGLKGQPPPVEHIVDACPSGHEYTPANSYVDKRGRRRCRTCARRAGPQYYQRRKAAPPDAKCAHCGTPFRRMKPSQECCTKLCGARHREMNTPI